MQPRKPYSYIAIYDMTIGADKQDLVHEIRLRLHEMWNSSFKLLGIIIRYPARYATVSLVKNSSTFSACGEALNWTPSLPCTSTIRLVNSKGINIEWGEEKDAQEDHFHGVWLRHNCHCHLCLRQEANQKVVDLAQLDEPSITNVALNGDNVEITWHTRVGEHKGYIPLQFLKDNRYSDEILMRKRRQSRPDKTAATENQVPEIECENILSSDEGLWRFLWNILEYGICIINNVSTVDWSVIPLAERISHLQDTLYGKTFEVVPTEKPIDLAYSGESLPLHMDLTYYEAPPGVQMLHCLKNSDFGGETTFVDTFPVVEEMRISHPKEFQTLTRVPATFKRVTRKLPAHIESRKPHIVLEEDEIIAVNWNTMVLELLDVSPADVEPYYKAYVLMGKLINSSERMLQIRLSPGQAIAFNNRRMVHGRNPFHGGARHLQGAFLNIDEVKSKFLVLHAIYGNGQAKRVFNNSVL